MVGFVEIRLADDGPVTTVEVQQLNGDDGPSLLVGVHRPDGTMDVAVPVDARFDAARCAVDPFLAHMDLGALTVTDFDRRRCVIDDRSVSVDVAVDLPEPIGRLTVQVDHRFASAGRPSFVPTVPGQQDPTTLRFMLAAGLRNLPVGAKPDVSVNGRGRSPAPAGSGKRRGWAARVGHDIFGVGLNRTGSAALAADGDGGDSGEVEILTTADRPIVAMERDRHRLAVRLYDEAGVPVTAAPHERRTVGGTFTVEASIGTVAKGRWRAGPDLDGWWLVLDDVQQSWFPGWSSPMEVARYLARRQRRSGETWCWEGRTVLTDVGRRDEGFWTVRTSS